MTALVLFLLALLEPPIPAERWLLVYPGHVETVVGPLRLSGEARDGLRRVWYWSPTTAPRRLEPDQLAAFVPPRDSDRLRLVVRTDEPLPAGARVVAAPADLWRDAPEALLPAWPVPTSGRLEIPWTRAESWRARLVAPRGEGGRGTWWAALRPGQASASLLPRPARDLRVEVADEDGRAIPDARLETLQAEAVRSRKSTFLALAAAADGVATLPTLPDAGELTLLVAADGFVPVAYQGLPSSLPPRVTLTRGARLHGRFVDGDRRPLAGVEVRLEAWLPGDFAAYVARGDTSAEDGSFTLTAVPAGRAVVQARKTGWAGRRAELEIGGTDLDLGELVLEPEATLTVRVVDELGQSVAGAELRPRPGERVVTDADGRADLRGVGAAQTVELAADARGYEPAERTLVPPHPPLVELRLDRAFLVRARFLDADGLPVPAGRARADAGPLGVHGTVTAGELELELPAGKAFELVLSSPSTAALRIDLEPGLAGEERDLGDLVAPPGHRLEGRLLSAVDATPVAGARVWLPRPSVGEHALEAWFFGDLLETTSAADGSFALEGLSSRDLRLTIDAAGFARRTLDLRPDPDAATTDLGTIELDAGAMLRVVANEEPPPGATARVDLGNRWLETEMLMAPFADGVATFPHVPPGEVTVTAVARGRLLCETKARLGSDEETEVVCRRSALRIRGVVTLAGRPAGAGRLSFLPPAPEHPSFIERGETPRGLGQARIWGGGRPQVDAEVEGDGRFATDELAPGRWSVLWTAASGAATASREVEIPEVAELELALDFAGLAVAGEVRDLDGRPVAGARVRELASGTLAQSEEDGEFLLLDLAPGRRWLRAEKGGLRSAAVAVDLEEDRPPGPVRLVLGTDEGPRELAVRVLVDGRPAAGAFVFLEVEGRPVRVLTADASGLATALFEPPYPLRLRLAGYGEGRFVLGDWQGLAELVETAPELVIERATGSLEITAEGDVPIVPGIVSAGGWDLAWLLTRLGWRPLVGEAPLLLAGLPPGSYQVGAAGDRRFVSVGGGEVVEVRLRGADEQE